MINIFYLLMFLKIKYIKADIQNNHPPLVQEESSTHVLLHPPMAQNSPKIHTPTRLSHQNIQYKVRSAQVLIRHGQRTPLYKLPNDNKKAWPTAQLGQLTIKGKLELIDLGKQFRARYILSKKNIIDNGKNENLLPEKFEGVASPFIYARSTDIDRALESAEMFLKGLYPDAVVPVHSVPTEEDFLLLGSRLCSKMDKRRQAIQLEESSSSKYSTLFQQLQLHTGIEHVSMSNFRTIADSILTLKEIGALNNNNMPNKLKSISSETLEETKDLLDTYMHDLYKIEMAGRLTGGNVLREILERIISTTQNAKNAEGDLPPRFVLYSTHANTIIGFLSALRKPVNRIPDFASQVVVELLEATHPPSMVPASSLTHGKKEKKLPSSFFIRFTYDGEAIKINGCKDVICEVSKVIRLIGNMVPSSTMAWNVECENRFNQYGPASLEGYLGIDWEEWPNMAVFLALVFIFETVAFDAIVCSKIKERQRQQRLKNDKNENTFLSQLEATTRNYSEKNDQDVKAYKKKQRKRSCYVLCIGFIGIMTCFVMFLAFGIEWNEWPIVAFILCTLIAVESSAIAAVFVHAKYFDDSHDNNNGGYYSSVPTTDSYDDHDNSNDEIDTDLTDEEINNQLNESDFGKVTDVL